MKEGEQLLVKVGVSAVDYDGARNNVEAEMPGFDFNMTRKNARDAWNGYLSKIDVPATADKNDLTKFYTALYHTAVAPNLFTDADGRYAGMDRKTKQGDVNQPVYTIFSIWDTFRALHPLMSIIDPDLNNDYMRSLLLKAGRVVCFLCGNLRELHGHYDRLSCRLAVCRRCGQGSELV